MATERQLKAREYVAASLDDAIGNLDDAIKLLPNTGWSPGEQNRIIDPVLAAYREANRARGLIGKLTPTEQDAEPAGGDA